MRQRLGEILAWMLFPAVPLLLESYYHGFLITSLIANASADPRHWGWQNWLSELGPLIGFGFLAGATLALPDEPTTRRGPRAWLGRRAFWVSVGPWAGFLAWGAAVWCLMGIAWIADSLSRPNQPVPAPPAATVPAPPVAAQETWLSWGVGWMFIIFLVATFCYGWLVFAIAVIRRGRRLGAAWLAVRRGLVTALAFVGSLFGSFWAVTEWWRAYFFDPRIMPAILAAIGVLAISGCGNTPISYGEARRRELFEAMLLAWTVGLALIWRWWARPGSKPPDPPA